MKCDLCKHEKAPSGHLLCAPCAEMVQRLLVVDERLRTAEAAEDFRSVNTTFVTAGSLA
jgi:hypothetical protein